MNLHLINVYQFSWSYLFALICILSASTASGKSIGSHATPANVKRTFNSARAREFFVDGKNIPLVHFDMGDSYSGILPAHSNDTELFFWFIPAQTHVGAKDITFWNNGGPCCSSLIGATMENGPFTLGDSKVVRNPYAWNKVSNMLYVEHPAPVGFSEGNVTVNDEVDVARALFGFMQNFLEIFPELKNANLWVAGESYAGYYVPHIAYYVQRHSSELALSLQGTLLIDPRFGEDVLQLEVPTYPFIKLHQDAFKFNATFMAHLADLHHSCGFDAYLDKYLRFPPPGPFEKPKPGIQGYGTYNITCDIYNLVLSNIGQKDFDDYNIYNTKPESFVKDSEEYFNRADVRAALHVPERAKKWTACGSSPNIFPQGDQSQPPAWDVYPKVLENSKRNVMAFGAWDFCLMADGAKLVIQNMTWSGAQGLAQPEPTPFDVPGQGQMGSFRTDRNFTFIDVWKSGHMVPKNQPKAALQILEFLLGQRVTPSQ